MFNDLLPRSFDNMYRGQKLALWLLGFIALIKAAMGLNSIFNGYDVATTADGIPLDSYPPVAAQAIVSMFAAWGLSVLILALLCILALVRYRSMVPFLFALLLLELLARKLIFFLMPIATTGDSKGYLVNLVLLAVMIAGLALSLWRRPEQLAHA
jgi:hypothetical protein